MEHGEMGHGEFGDMSVSGPAGIALAAGGPDRDGLEMDILHLRLGPVLADWPAGLVLWCSLQGDAIAGVDVETTDVFAAPQRSAAMTAYRIDAAARLLSLAGAPAGASLVRLRDLLLGGAALEGVLDELAQVRRAVARSSSLRWSLNNLGEIDAGLVRQHRWPISWTGDVYERLLHLLDVTSGSTTAAHQDPSSEGPAELRAIAAVLPLLLPGMDLAAARLVVASLVGHPAAPTLLSARDEQRVGF